MADTNSEERLKNWATQEELSENTLKVLTDHGFTSLRACRRLSPAAIQKHFGKLLPLGQLLLLEGAVEELSVSTVASGKETAATAAAVTAATSGTTSRTEDQEQIDYNRLCQLLNVDQDGGAPGDTALQGQEDNIDGKPHIFDPFQLYSTSSGGTKARDIREYCLFAKTTLSTPASNPVKIGDVEITLSSEQKKIPLDKLSPLQYMEGSLRILREMVLKDGIKQDAVLAYVGYLTKVACMGQTFPWKSVLLYDHEYRKHQACLGFPWGADSPFLMQLLLGQDRTSTASSRGSDGAQKQRSGGRNKFDPGSGRNICQKFNGRNGCNLQSCKFAHVCFTCYSRTHGDFNHKTTTRPTVTDGVNAAPKND